MTTREPIRERIRNKRNAASHRYQAPEQRPITSLKTGWNHVGLFAIHRPCRAVVFLFKPDEMERNIEAMGYPSCRSTTTNQRPRLTPHKSGANQTFANKDYEGEHHGAGRIRSS